MTVQQLNQHPLNQAALRRLRQEGGEQHPLRLHLLSLAQFGLEDQAGEPLPGDDPLRKPLEDFSLSREHQQSALDHLQEAFDPSQVLNRPLRQLSQDISLCLRGATLASR